MTTAAWIDDEAHRPPLERVRHDVKFRWIQVESRVRLRAPTWRPFGFVARYRRLPIRTRC
jgi:hypothetical protein